MITSAAFWGICTERYTAGNSLELLCNPPGIPLATLPGITLGLEDHLRRRPPWNLWDSADSPSGSTSPTLSGNTRPPGFYLPHAFSREPYLYHPVFRVCVCVSLKTVSRRVFLCLVFREQFIPAGVVFIFVQEPYLYHPVFKVCVCVCVCVCDSRKTVLRRVFLCLIFREQFMPIGSVLSFQSTFDIPSAF